MVWEKIKSWLFRASYSIILFNCGVLYCHQKHVSGTPLVPTHQGSGTSSSSLLLKPGPITFDDLLDAIEQVESGGDPWAIGDNGNAVGSFQIWKIYVDDVNRISNDKFYAYIDRFDRRLSREMVDIYTKYYLRRVCRVVTSPPKKRFTGWDSRVFEFMARIHNGGPNGYKKESTKPYWEKVKAELWPEVAE